MEEGMQRNGWSIAAIGCVLMAGAYVVVLHWQHVGLAVPVLLLLLCPLFHVFHHGGHRHHEKST